MTLPGRLDPDRAGLVRPQAGLLDEAADAHADVAALGPRLLLHGREVGVAGERGRLLQAGRVVAGVVDDRPRQHVAELAVQRQLLGLDHVAQPHLHRVEAEVGGDAVDDPLHRERGLHVADTAERVHRRLVGHDHLGRGLEVLEVVGPGQHAHADERLDHGQALQVGPGVGHAVVADGEDPAVVVVAHLDVVELLAPVGGGDEVLPAVLDPLDRALDAPRDAAQEDLLRVDLQLDPEAAAEVGGDHADAVLGQAERGLQVGLDPVGNLGGAVEREAAALLVGGDDAAGLHRHAGVALGREALAQHVRGAGEGAGGVAVAVVQGVGEVGLEVEDRGVGLQRALGVHHRGQRRVVDLQERHQVLGVVAVLGHDHRDRLAHVAHLVPGQDRLQERQRGLLGVDADELGHVLEVGGGEHGHAARVGQQRRGVDAADLGVRVRAAHDGRVQHPVELDVGDVLAPAAQQPRVLLALQRGAERAPVAGAHARLPLSSPAACSTASTIFT